MDSNSKGKFRKELEVEGDGDIVGCLYPVRLTRKERKAAERDMSRFRCGLERNMERKKYNRKRTVIVFFGGVGLVFLLLLL